MNRETRLTWIDKTEKGRGCKSCINQKLPVRDSRSRCHLDPQYTGERDYPINTVCGDWKLRGWRIDDGK